MVPARGQALLEIAGPTTVPGLLGRVIADERGLSLAQAPVHVVTQGYSNGDVGFAVVIAEALGARALMDLLYTLAPYKAHGPDRFARVLDNWGLHDRARTSSGSESLLLQHASALKFSWHEFARHRDLFIEILEGKTERRVVPVVTWTKTADGHRQWQFEALDGHVTQAIEKALPFERDDGRTSATLDSLVGLVTIPYFCPELHRNWLAWQPLVKDGKSNYIGPASVPVVALRHRRALLNSAFIHSIEAYVEGVSE